MFLPYKTLDDEECESRPLFSSIFDDSCGCNILHLAMIRFAEYFWLALP